MASFWLWSVASDHRRVKGVDEEIKVTPNSLGRLAGLGQTLAKLGGTSVKSFGRGATGRV
jgi:hypothetical protein